jgi:hypothetical protein
MTTVRTIDILSDILELIGNLTVLLEYEGYRMLLVVNMEFGVVSFGFHKYRRV